MYIYYPKEEFRQANVSRVEFFFIPTVLLELFGKFYCGTVEHLSGDSQVGVTYGFKAMPI